jgi:predicted Co/Zn/Cd cation transporter (cation efflux family)
MQLQCRVHWQALLYERWVVGFFIRLNENHLYLNNSGSSNFIEINVKVGRLNCTRQVKHVSTVNQLFHSH